MGYIDGTLENVHPSAVIPNMILPESQWFKPKLSDVGYLFNGVFEDYKKWVKKAKSQGFHSRKNFSFKIMKDQIKDIFERNLIKMPKKLELNIPTIKMPQKPKSTLKKV